MTEEITAQGETVEEEGGDDGETTITIEEEFRELLAGSEEIQERLSKVSGQLSKKPQASGEDLAALYGFLQGDVVSLVQDLIKATGAALNETFDLLESGEESGSEDDGDDNDDLDDATIQIYATLQANVQAFSNLIQVAPEEQKVALQQLLAMNENTMALVRENVGEEVAQKAAEWMDAARQQAAAEKTVEAG